MPSLVVIGAQWGDEGKGKLVDVLTAKADWTVRYQGGNNAGHTLVVNGVKTKLSLVPSGILHHSTRCLIGAGVVLNPEVLAQEMQALKQSGVEFSKERLVIDRDAHLILPYYVAIDQAREESKGTAKIGTTGRGIGPAYEARAARCGVRLADLFDLNGLRPRLQHEVEAANALLGCVLKSQQVLKFEDTWDVIVRAAENLSAFVGNGSLLLDQALRSGARVVFEGAQGTLLDQCFGTIPFVTSSSTISGAVATGCGISPKHINYVLGVVKAYSTRVGSGPFPTELHDAVGNEIRERGAEFGTVTGRPRRCGWLDAFALRRAVRLNGLDSVVITKLDVLTGLEQLKICVGYELRGQRVDDLPALVSEFEAVRPIYLDLPGWSENISHIKKLSDLPPTAREYLKLLEHEISCPISMVSVSPERSSTIICDNIGTLSEFV